MISVVIPAYNRKDTLPRTIDSVLKQSIKDVEILVCDDGSTDGTNKLFPHSDSRVSYYALPTNQGVVAARNFGIERAKGEYIAFLDSDDELLPDGLERLLEPMKDNKIGIVMAPYRLSTGELTGYDWPEGEIAFDRLLAGEHARKRKATFSLMRRSVVGSL